ncbi:MAG: aminopeptidase P family protein [Mangrovicoccus sp.]
MFQDFVASASPDQGPPRLAALRAEMETEGLQGFLVPRSDAHQGEYVAPRDERLSWLTGFTGSAGFALILQDRALMFVDGRYRVQVRHQTDQASFEVVHWPEVKLGDWLCSELTEPAVIGFDPWLHTVAEIEAARIALAGSEITLVETDNLVDRIWPDQPGPPMGKAISYPETMTGQSSAAKRQMLADELSKAGQSAAVITLPDSLCWLLNIRGSDIQRNPLAQGFAILHADARVDLFMAAEKLEELDPPLANGISVHAPDRFAPALEQLSGAVLCDRGSLPVAVHAALIASEAEPVIARDPCILPKACKTEAELTAARIAHRRDAGAMVEFLAWLDAALADLVASSRALSEIEVVTKLEETRAATGALRDISFDTICGTGPHGAIVHYRVTEDTNRAIAPGDLLLVDSGGQYLDGTTDITRTMAVGDPSQEQRDCFTRVLKGMIAVSQARFPKGLAGRDLDALARSALWQAGLDYDHGTGHGVGQYLSVHEGPQRLSRQAHEVLRPGMILSNEPGYYREDAFGIRIENLIVVEPAPDLPGADPQREMLAFETLTYVPIDRRLIDLALLTASERAWMDAYHKACAERLGGDISSQAADWLERATAPL